MLGDTVTLAKSALQKLASSESEEWSTTSSSSINLTLLRDATILADERSSEGMAPSEGGKDAGLSEGWLDTGG